MVPNVLRRSALGVHLWLLLAAGVLLVLAFTNLFKEHHGLIDFDAHLGALTAVSLTPPPTAFKGRRNESRLWIQLDDEAISWYSVKVDTTLSFYKYLLGHLSVGNEVIVYTEKPGILPSLTDTASIQELITDNRALFRRSPDIDNFVDKAAFWSLFIVSALFFCIYLYYVRARYSRLSSNGG